MLALEGGYKLSVLPQCVESCLLALMEDSTTNNDHRDDNPPGSHHDDDVHPEALKSIQATIQAHSRYWPCLIQGQANS